MQRKDKVVANKKVIAGRSPSSKPLRNDRDRRLAAVRGSLTKYFLGSASTADKFWSTSNPSLGERSPAQLVKSGKLNLVEQYVTYLRKHAGSVKPEFSKMQSDVDFTVYEGTKEEILDKLKETPANYGGIAISFPDAESYYTYAPLFRQIVDRLPEIVRRHQRKQQLLFARLLFSFTADLPIPVPKSRALSQRVQREAARKLAALGGTMPDLPEIPRRRVPRE